MMRALVLSALVLGLGCYKPPPVGQSTKNAFAAQVEAGKKPDGASRLSTSEARDVVGGGSKKGGKGAASKGAGGTKSQTPLNTDASGVDIAN